MSDAESARPFGGDEAGHGEFETARAVVLPAGLERTVSFGTGTGAGPRAILCASAELEFFDEITWRPYWKDGDVHTLSALTFDGDGQTAVWSITEAARPAIRGGKFLLTLGGEHTVTAGAVRALFEQDPECGVLIVDAHLDLRDEYDGDPWSHACVARRIVDDYGPPMSWVGVRSVAAEEATLLEAADFAVQYAHNIATDDRTWIDRALAPLPERVYLSIDVDGLDPSVMPGTGTPEPGGLSYRQLLALIEAAAKRRRIVAADVVEVAPIAGQQVSEFTAAKIAAKLIGAVLRHR